MAASRSWWQHVLVDPSDRQLGLLAVPLHLERFYFLTCHWRSLLPTATLGAGPRWMLWRENVVPVVVDIIIPWYHRWDATDLGPSPGRRATSICASLLAAALFIDIQSHVGDGASLDLEMVRLGVSSNTCLGDIGVWWRSVASVSAGNPRVSSIFF
jgi:hypothetical protein